MSDIQLDAVLVGKAISKARQSKGVTQEVLSGLADIGRTHLSAIERGERKPTLETLWRIAFALDMHPSELVTKIEEEIEKNNEA
ncbi:MAG: helix-turn-helix domain-containing protein [Oscillospiraceae bacterium]|nr:helix-turn-helix domain-containing protein [Oscillospiraceae bacterium]